jgi:hypothetical protein
MKSVWQVQQLVRDAFQPFLEYKGSSQHGRGRRLEVGHIFIVVTHDPQVLEEGKGTNNKVENF